jgi:probable FeS assembly SUF system protein SufT
MNSYSLARDTAATLIPAGDMVTLPAATPVDIVQTLGGNVTVRTERGLFRISAQDVSAISGYVPEVGAAEVAGTDSSLEFSEAGVWDALKTCFDPEIPVNIVDLGLVYDLNIEKVTPSTHRVEVKMTLTAQGCGMGPTIAEDARQKIAALPSVAEAKVYIVWEPMWAPQMISAQGRKILGLE